MPWISAQLWERLTPQTPYLFVIAACLISVPIVWAKFKLPDDEEPAAAQN